MQTTIDKLGIRIGNLRLEHGTCHLANTAVFGRTALAHGVPDGCPTIPQGRKHAYLTRPTRQNLARLKTSDNSALLQHPNIISRCQPELVLALLPDHCMKVDLHSHSYYSDGKHSPAFLLQRALQNGLTHLAVTDHDCLKACDELAALSTDLTIINGVEISCNWEELEIHVLGLCIDTSNAALTDLLAKQQQHRRDRMKAMDAKLNGLGTTGLWDYLNALPCVAFTRSHVADFLVQRGRSANRQKAFKAYLSKRGRIYIAPQWCGMLEAIAAIRAAGGIACIAHPCRYSISKRKLERLVAEFKAAGGEALEVSYGNIQPEHQLYLQRLASAQQLWTSVGSDFHDSEATWTDLGRFPALDEAAKKSAIWLHPGWHF